MCDQGGSGGAGEFGGLPTGRQMIYWIYSACNRGDGRLSRLFLRGWKYQYKRKLRKLGLFLLNIEKCGSLEDYL